MLLHLLQLLQQLLPLLRRLLLQGEKKTRINFFSFFFSSSLFVVSFSFFSLAISDGLRFHGPEPGHARGPRRRGPLCLRRLPHDQTCVTLDRNEIENKAKKKREREKRRDHRFCIITKKKKNSTSSTFSPLLSFLSLSLCFSPQKTHKKNRPRRAQALATGPRIPTSSRRDRPGRSGVSFVRLGSSRRRGPAPKVVDGREPGAARWGSVQGHGLDDARAQGDVRASSCRCDQADEREVVV